MEREGGGVTALPKPRPLLPESNAGRIQLWWCRIGGGVRGGGGGVLVVLKVVVRVVQVVGGGGG